MHKIEVEAHKTLQEQQNFSPKIYKRYIDGINIGSVERTDIADKILHTFNSVNKNIQLTLEIYPKKINFWVFWT